jgi:hypothetical protein
MSWILRRTQMIPRGLSILSLLFRLVHVGRGLSASTAQSLALLSACESNLALAYYCLSYLIASRHLNLPRSIELF